MSSTPAHIIGVGVVSPVGGNAWQTAASVRARINRYAISPCSGRRNQPLTMALVPAPALHPLDAEAETAMAHGARTKRVLRMVIPAVYEALSGSVTGRAPIPLFLALPEVVAGANDLDGIQIIRQVSRLCPNRIDRKRSVVFPAGRAGGIQALAAAMTGLQNGDFTSALVLGADSHWDMRTLSRLDGEDRVLSEGVMDGFAPGEAAACIMVSASADGRPCSPKSLTVAVHHPGVADEAGHRASDQPNLGVGLSAAIASALSATDNREIRSVLTSANGESATAKEWGTALLRNRGAFVNDLRIDHPADCYGDVGAASGPLLLALAAIGLTKGYLRGPCLIWAASDSAPRGAVYLESR